MATKEQTSSALLTSELIESVIADLPAQARAMVRLLLLQYFDLTSEDIVFMAGDRPDPRFAAGVKPPLDKVTKEAIDDVADRVAEYQSRARLKRERIGLMLDCLQRMAEIAETQAKVAEQLLRSRYKLQAEELEALKKAARTAVTKVALRALESRRTEQTLSDDEFVRERLAIEYQVQARFLDRHQKRMTQTARDQQITGFSPLQDHEIAHIWGLPVSSLSGRKVKHVHQYVEALQARLRTAGWAPDPTRTSPVDLWQETFAVLSRLPIPRSVAQYDGTERTEEALLEKLRALALGGLPEDVESRFWQSLAQDVRHGAEHGSRPFSLFGLQRLSAILAEVDHSPEALEQELLDRITPKAEVEAAPEERKLEEIQLGDMAEHVLKSMRGG